MQSMSKGRLPDWGVEVHGGAREGQQPNYDTLQARQKVIHFIPCGLQELESINESQSQLPGAVRYN